MARRHSGIASHASEANLNSLSAGEPMKPSNCLVGLLAVLSLVHRADVFAQTDQNLSRRILSAKTVYFDNQTGSDAVGKSTIAELKKWGQFRLITEKREADLIFLLSADPFRGGNIIYSGGQTGTLGQDGTIEKDPFPDHNKLSPTRYAYLTVIDSKSGEALWKDSHLWGDLLTGFNSVGSQMVKKLKVKLKK